MACKHRRNNVLRRSILVLLGLVLGFNVYMLNAKNVAQNQLPMPFGIGAAVVQSSSMEPTYSKGDILFVKQLAQYAAGDVVVYESEGILVVHRVIQVEGNINTTQGDANNTPDAPFDASCIKGAVVGCIPALGSIVDFLKTPLGIFLVLALSIALVEVSFRRQRQFEQNSEEAANIKNMQQEIDSLKKELGE